MAARDSLLLLLLVAGMITSFASSLGPDDAYTGKKPSLRMTKAFMPAQHGPAGLPLMSGVLEIPSPAEAAADPDAVQSTGQTATDTSSEALEQAARALNMPVGVAAAVSAAPGSCAYKYAHTDIRPIRTMWESGSGYCGENSLQMILAARGVWISQAQARSLAGCGTDDLLIQDRETPTCNVLPLLRNKLAFAAADSDYWDSYNQTLTYAKYRRSSVWPYAADTVGYTSPSASDFLLWAKRQIIAGRSMMIAVRLKNNADSYYDHIVPLWGVCSTDANASAPLIATDAFSMSTDLSDEVNRLVGDPGMFSRWKECPYSYSLKQVGCIPSDIYNYGLAVGHLRDPNNVLVKTTKLAITAWSNGWPADAEPGEKNQRLGSSTTASYTLSVWGLTAGVSYTTFRIRGPLPGTPPAVPPTKAAMHALCASLGSAACRSTTYTAPSTKAVNITETALGAFPANSLQYFFTVA